VQLNGIIWTVTVENGRTSMKHTVNKISKDGQTITSSQLHGKWSCLEEGMRSTSRHRRVVVDDGPNAAAAGSQHIPAHHQVTRGQMEADSWTTTLNCVQLMNQPRLSTTMQCNISFACKNDIGKLDETCRRCRDIL